MTTAAFDLKGGDLHADATITWHPLRREQSGFRPADSEEAFAAASTAGRNSSMNSKRGGGLSCAAALPRSYQPCS